MALATGHVASQLRHIIYYHLDNNLVRNALFLAERLHAYEPRSFESQYLLSLCHLHNGEVKAAFEFSQASGSRGMHAGCAYVYAQACLDLGKFLDGATALERCKALWVSKNHWSRFPLPPRRAFGYEVLTVIQTSIAKHNGSIFRMLRQYTVSWESCGRRIRI